MGITFRDDEEFVFVNRKLIQHERKQAQLEVIDKILEFSKRMIDYPLGYINIVHVEDIEAIRKEML